MKRFWLLIPIAAWLARAQSDTVLTLEQAIDEALANNLELAAAKLNISVTQAREISARLRPNPVLSVSGQTLGIIGSHYSPSSPAGPNQLNVHTELPVELRSKRAARVTLAKEDVSLAELGFREQMRGLIADVQSAYLDVQQARENLTLAGQNLGHLNELVEINRARLAAGDLAQVELDRSLLAALQFQTAVQQAQLAYDQTRAQLLLIMGRKTRALDFSVADTIRQAPITETAPELYDLALTRRPDVLASQQAEVRSRADLRLQMANAKVDYAIGTEFTRQSAYGMAGNSVGLYLSVPMPFFNRNQGEIARASREGTQANVRTQSLKFNVEGEIQAAYRDYTISSQLLKNIESNLLVRARNVRDTTEYSYKRGEASLVEFLDAQRAFNDAMQSYNDARVRYARSLYRLDAVSGATVSTH